MLKLGQRLPEEEVGNFNHSFFNFYLEREVGVVEMDQPEYQHEGDVDKEEESKSSLRRLHETRQHLGSFEQCLLIKSVQG